MDAFEDQDVCPLMASLCHDGSDELLDPSEVFYPRFRGVFPWPIEFSKQEHLICCQSICHVLVVGQKIAGIN